MSLEAKNISRQIGKLGYMLLRSSKIMTEDRSIEFCIMEVVDCFKSIFS